jgi:hypothetical protein
VHPTVYEPSFMSLYLGMRVRSELLATGTGFVVEHDGQPFLITNRHNLSGRRSDTNELMSPETGAVPDTVVITHVCTDGLGVWIQRHEPLYDGDGRPRWREHPEYGRTVDVVALPLTNLGEVALHPYPLQDLSPDVVIGVTDNVNVVGFPLDMHHAGYLAIWARGTVASEFHIDYAELPMFLIDSRTRRGQSGSPVIFFSGGGHYQLDGEAEPRTGHLTKLLGIYSGRVSNDSDLGFVWRLSAIQDVVRRGVPPSEN